MNQMEDAHVSVCLCIDRHFYLEIISRICCSLHDGKCIVKKVKWNADERCLFNLRAQVSTSNHNDTMFIWAWIM